MTPFHNTVIKAGDGLGIYTSEPFDHARIEHNLFIGGKPPAGVSYGGYSPGRGSAMDVQRFGDHCILDHNSYAYAIVGQPFEGKIRTSTFTTLPGQDFEANGRVIEVSAPFPARIPPASTTRRTSPACVRRELMQGIARHPFMVRGSRHCKRLRNGSCAGGMARRRWASSTSIGTH